MIRVINYCTLCIAQQTDSPLRIIFCQRNQSVKNNTQTSNGFIRVIIEMNMLKIKKYTF